MITIAIKQRSLRRYTTVIHYHGIRLIRDAQILATRLLPRCTTGQAYSPKTSVVSNGSIARIPIDDDAKQIILGTIPRHGIDIQVGQFAELHKSFSQEDVNIFGTLISDMNPVHFPNGYATNTKENTNTDTLKPPDRSYEKPIVHGMLLSSLFSSIFGTLIPGAIYRSQSLKFNNSVALGEHVVGKVIVRKLKQVNRSDNGVLCTCDTNVLKTDVGTIAIAGEAQVWLPGATIKTSETT